MNRDDIIRMAHEAGLHIATDHDWMPIIALAYAQKFAEVVRAEEREACIKLLEDFSQTQMVPVVDTWRMGLVAGVLALRGRGQG